MSLTALLETSDIITIIEINLVTLCFIKIYKIGFVFLYLSSYGKDFKMAKANRCTRT